MLGLGYRLDAITHRAQRLRPPLRALACLLNFIRICVWSPTMDLGEPVLKVDRQLLVDRQLHVLLICAPPRFRPKLFASHEHAERLDVRIFGLCRVGMDVVSVILRLRPHRHRRPGIVRAAILTTRHNRVESIQNCLRDVELHRRCPLPLIRSNPHLLLVVNGCLAVGLFEHVREETDDLQHALFRVRHLARCLVRLHAAWSVRAVPAPGGLRRRASAGRGAGGVRSTHWAAEGVRFPTRPFTIATSSPV